MKQIFNKLPLLIAVAVLFVTSCKKDETRAVLQMGAAPELTGSATSVVLDSANNSNTAVTFSWPAGQYGFNADVTYTLQFDASASDSFKNATNVVLPVNTLTKSYTVQDFNTLAYQTLGLPANTASPVSVRVKSDVNQNGLTTGPSTIPTTYSNVFSM